MAEYYPLLARAVAGLGGSTPEVRRGIYERARKALLGQLKSIEPPVPAEDIDRESRALDAAVEKLEAELVSKESAKSAPAAASNASNRPPPPSPRAPRAPLTPRPPRPLEPKKDEALVNGAAPPAPARPPIAPSNPNGRPVAAAGAAAMARAVPGFAREAPARVATPLPERRPLPPPQSENSWAPGATVEAKAQPAQVVPPPAAEPSPPVVASQPPSPAAEPAPTRAEAAPRAAPTLRDNLRDFARPRETLTSEFESVLRAQDTASPQISPSARGEPIRPIVQRPVENERRSLRHWIVGTVVLVVVAVVAIMAFILRDNPADLVKRAQPVAAANSADQGPDKIVARIGVGPSPAVGAAPTQTAQPATAPVPATAPPAAAPAVGSAAAPAAAPAAAQPAATPDAVAPAPANPAIPVAQRAALVVDAPNTPQKVQTYVGTVVWRLENVSKGPGQPLAVALRADVNIPDAKFTASMELEKNTDATLPASHTIELKFVFAPDSPVPAVQRIETPYMRNEDQPQGDALVGAAQQVVPDYFLVALTQGDTNVTNNIKLITSRGWMDVPMLLMDGRIAKLTFEKGTSGDQALQDALAAWQK